MKRIVFITGTRADYGKLKALIKSIEKTDGLEAYIYVSGMHLLKTFGSTYNEILKDKYQNVHIAYGLANSKNMSYNLGDVICNFTGYVTNIRPDMIVVHGDRIDALAGAVVGALNNIRVAHIEGGELSGTIDESIRHAISKLAHIHLVCNEDAKNRLIQLGEEEKRIYILGSPDIDIMNSNLLPDLQTVKTRYDIDFDNYGIFMYHPVTTEYHVVNRNIKTILSAIEKTKYNYIIIYPNNDFGSEIIINEYKKIESNPKFRIFPSVRFESFLTLLKNAQFVIGNSSAGIRETSIYGIPSIDIGSRQTGRYNVKTAQNIQHVNESMDEIIDAIGRIHHYRKTGSLFGSGNSADRFIEILKNEDIWKINIQKNFVDITFEETNDKIENIADCKF